MNDKANLQFYPCPVCRRESNRKVYTIEDFPIVQCYECSMVYVNPRFCDESIYEIHESNYFNMGPESDRRMGYEDYERTAHLRIKTFQRWYRDIEPYLLVKPGRALDVGCAAGYLLDVLVEHGWEVKGIEIDKSMHKKIVQRGFDVSQSLLENYESEKPFHLITLFDVIEHMPNLHRNIEKLFSLLHDNGAIALVTPNFESFQRKLLGRRWFQFKPLEHINYFTPKTLNHACDSHGLSVIHESSSGQYADLSFIHDRLRRYGFARLASLMRHDGQLPGPSRRLWYINTGSMLVILRKRGFENSMRSENNTKTELRQSI